LFVIPIIAVYKFDHNSYHSEIISLEPI